MAKAAKKKSPKKASNIFHDIMKASVSGNPKPNFLDKGEVLNMEKYLKSENLEMRQLGSSMTSSLPNIERKAMMERLNTHEVNYQIIENRIVKNGDE